MTTPRTPLPLWAPPRPDEELQALCDRATPGPWKPAVPGSSCYVKCPKCDQGEYVAKSIGSTYGAPHHALMADAAFIAAARSAVPSLLARVVAAEKKLAAVEALHRKITTTDDYGFCTGCEFSWPCPTVAALDDATEVAR